MLEEETRDIEAGQINSIVNAIVIGITKKAIMPRFEIAVEHQIHLEMEMRPRLVQSFTAVTHARDPFAAIDSLTDIHHDFTQVPVKAVVRRPVPNMLDDNVTSVV